MGRRLDGCAQRICRPGKRIWRSAGEKNAAVGVPTGCYIVKVGGRTAKVLVK
ncbi:MAG: hypothetical protein SO104_00935 [Prevotella sp.]|nr:hypothetical protein [Prevotella sp.]